MAIRRGAIYCRVAYRGEPDTQPLDVQELCCRRQAVELDVQIDIRHVYIDALRQSWEPDAPAPGWQSLLEAIRREPLTDVIVFGLERFLRRPAELLALAKRTKSAGIRLHGCPPVAIADLLGEAQRRLATMKTVSSRVLAAQHKASLAGLPHGGGRRPYGYQPGMKGLEPDEASIVREVYQSYRDGASLTRIANSLNVRGVSTAIGGRWTAASVARILDAPRYACPDSGMWPACVDMRLWEQVQVKRHAPAQPARRREYLLTGLLKCSGCGRHMVGSVVGTYRMYVCTKSPRWTGVACRRSIAADPLEALVQERACLLLESLDRRKLATLAVAVATDGSAKVRPHRAMDGVTVGRSARKTWNALTHKRRQDVLRFLYAAIYIGESTTIRSVFDESRVDLVCHPL